MLKACFVNECLQEAFVDLLQNPCGRRWVDGPQFENLRLTQTLTGLVGTNCSKVDQEQKDGYLRLLVKLQMAGYYGLASQFGYIVSRWLSKK